jgi:hypothetical protein
MLNEKSASKTQQRLFGQAYSVKLWKRSGGSRGIDPKDLNPQYKKEIVQLANSMSLAKLKEFAHTKHKDLPEEVKEGVLKDIYYKLSPDDQYKPARKKERAAGNLADYREYINKNKKTVMEQKVNEDCGCGQSSGAQPIPNISYAPTDPNVGKFATLADGRTGTINDSIRNSTGEVIGYVLNNDRGNFRVFRDKVTQISESEGAMATLANTPGMGDVVPPTRDSVGSGDQFPTLTAGTPAAKGKKTKAKKMTDDDVDKKALMGWNEFKKQMTKLQ